MMIVRFLIKLIFVPGPYVAPVFAFSIPVAGVGWYLGYTAAKLYFLWSLVGYVGFGLLTIGIDIALEYYQGYYRIYSFAKFVRRWANWHMSVAEVVHDFFLWPKAWNEANRICRIDGGSLARDVVTLVDLPARCREARRAERRKEAQRLEFQRQDEGVPSRRFRAPVSGIQIRRSPRKLRKVVERRQRRRA